MNRISTTDRNVTGLTALFAGLLSVLMVALYFVYDGPPPVANVLGRNLITVATFIGFLVFSAGLARVLKQSRGGDAGLSGSVAVLSMAAYAVVTLVSASLEVGTPLWRPEANLDPTVDGPLSAATVLLHGPIARGLVAAFLIALTICASRTGLLGRVVRTGSIVLALANLALVPSLFFGMNPANFYAANGWGATATIGVVNMIWFAVIGAALLRGRVGRSAATAAVPVPATAR